MNSVIPDWLISVYVLMIGLCIGSFLNVAALRGLSGEDMVLSRSKCPHCHNLIKWYMNIPLLSFIFLKGKCAYCKAKISWQYPIVEFITGILFLVIYNCWGLTLKGLFLIIIACFFILLALTDILETVILDYHAYILTVIGLLYALTGSSDITIVQSVVAAVAGFLIFEGLSRIGLLFSNMRMFGQGDSLIALALGAIFGFKTLLIIIALSFIIQTFAAVPVLVKLSIEQKKIKLALTYVVIFISMLLIGIINCFDIIKDDDVYSVCIIVICIILILSLRVVVKEIKNKKSLLDLSLSEEEKINSSPFKLLPFGPALIISALICLFWLTQIKEIIVKFLY